MGGGGVREGREKVGLSVHNFFIHTGKRRTERQKDRKTERQKDRKTERQKDRKTD
jgi:hypothetical protein